MIEPNFQVEYLHESTKTIWMADRQLNEKEKAAFDSASGDDLSNLGYIFSRDVIPIDFNSKDFEFINQL